MRPLIIILAVLLTACHSDRKVQSEYTGRSTVDTQTRSDTRRSEQVHDLYSAATTIELTDITVGLRQKAQADTTAPPAEENFCHGLQRGEPPATIHIGKATITNTTAAEKHLKADSATEDTTSHHSDTAAESKQQSESDIRSPTGSITVTFWILAGILLASGYLYTRHIRPK